MIGSKGSVVGGSCGSGDAAGFVVPDRRGQRLEALPDSGADAGGFAPVVAFQASRTFRVWLTDSGLWRSDFKNRVSGRSVFSPSTPGLVVSLRPGPIITGAASLATVNEDATGG